MRFIGGKSLLLDRILNVINENAPNSKTIIDCFSGSGVVSESLKENGYKTYSNDYMYFSYVLSRGTTGINREPQFTNLQIKDPITYLNALTLEESGYSLEDCFIYKNYSPNDSCQRMYFQNKNAIKIDIIRLTIESWRTTNQIDEDEYYYLLAVLLEAVPYISNITGTFGAYLKHWDNRSYNDLELKKPKIIKSNYKCKAYNEEVISFLKKVKGDVLYADPPYNQRQYAPNYHLLETIAKYDKPKVSGVTGIRPYDDIKSDFCIKSRVKEAFSEMFEVANVKFVVVSYNNEGLLSTDELMEIANRFAVPETLQLFEYPYRRYKSKIKNDKEGLKEQLLFFEKRNGSFEYAKSPFNYIGNKYKLLPQIIPLFPNEIDNFVDLFAGGLDVAINTNAKHVLCNDINYHVIDIYKEFQKYSLPELLETIEGTIKKWNLSKHNKEAYLSFRSYYNTTRRPIDLFVLNCYSFNYQFRFNSEHKYNNPFGKDRSSFNNSMKSNLISFHKRINTFEFCNQNFADFDISGLGENDFVYADPPYLITTGSYNDGKRGFNGWTEKNDQELFDILDRLNDQKCRFALSNVIYHKGNTNFALMKWMQKYKVYYLDKDYSNSSYHSKNDNSETQEVLVTNYKIGEEI